MVQDTVAIKRKQQKRSLARLSAIVLFVSTALVLYLSSSKAFPQEAIAVAPREQRIPEGDHRRVRRSELVTRDDANGTLAQIISPDGLNMAYTSSNGNIYLEPVDTSDNSTDSSGGFDTTTYWYSDPDDSTVYSDYEGRVLHIYSGELAQYGITRLRLHDVDALPKTSELVTLVPIAKTGGATLVAVTTDAQFIYLAACNIKNQSTKIFGMASYPGGLTTLQDPAMQTKVTGGVVEGCVLIDLNSGGAGRS